MRHYRLQLGILACCLPACAAPPGLPAGFCTAAIEAPEEQPVRLQVDGDRIVGAAAPLGLGGLPTAVRTLVDAIEPGGTTVHAARQWCRRGDGYRVEKTYGEGPAQQFRSALIAADGKVLERSHTVPVAAVPPRVLLAAMSDTRREVLRAEVVSGTEREEGWRITLRDGGGRTFVCECGLAGELPTVHRLLRAELLMPLLPAGH